MITAAVVGNEPRSRLIRRHYPRTTIRLAEYRLGRRLRVCPDFSLFLREEK